MKSFGAIGLLALGSLFGSGCIYYEGGDGCGPDCWDGSDWDDWGDDLEDEFDGDSDADTEEPPADEEDYTCTPDAAHPGDTLIADVTSNDGDDLSATVDVQVFGDCAILHWEASADSIMLVLEVDPEATGACDVLIENEDGSTDFFDDALDVHEDQGETDPCNDPAADDTTGGDGSGGDGSGGDGSEPPPDGSGDDCDL